MMTFACQVDFAIPPLRDHYFQMCLLCCPPGNLSLPLIDGAKTHVTFMVGVATQLMRSNTRYVLLGVINGTLKSMHEK